MKTSIAAIFALLLTGSMLSAQQLPNTNMYLFDFKEVNDSTFLIGNPRYLTDFNSEGYNNQPCFINNNELYFTAQFPDDTTQTDIWSFNFEKKTLVQITATSESEYSPQPVPALVKDEEEMPRTYFSTVRVESDGNNTQRIWQFPLDRSGNGYPALQSVKGVGYYLWLNKDLLSTFIVGNPHHMAMVNKTTENVKNITSNIGRSFQKMPQGNMAFVHKMPGSSPLVKGFDPRTNRTWLHTATLPGSEDFIALPDGTLLMGNGGKLYKFHRGIDNGWREIADFSYYGINNITRLAVSGNKLVLVN